MATGWTAIGEREDGDMTGISTLKYFGDSNSGQMARGWRYITDDPKDSEDHNNDFSFGTATSGNAAPSDAEFDGDGAWYYFDNSGVPAYLPKERRVYVDGEEIAFANKEFELLLFCRESQYRIFQRDVV